MFLAVPPYTRVSIGRGGLPFLQIALWLGAYALVGHYFGPGALVLTSPLLAVGIRRPLFALAAGFRHAVRSHVWLPVHGQHYVFRGITIHVVEDGDQCRWVRLADVHKVTGSLANERTLAAAYPGGVQTLGAPAQPHMRDDLLVTHLGKLNQPEALRLRTWVERNIARPGQRVRANTGIDKNAS